MWPWEHLAFGFLLFAATDRVAFDGPVGDRPAWALAVGTQFPDLVDKPLAWSLHLLPNGTSLAHSVFSVAVVCTALLVLSRRVGGTRSVVAFTVGYLSHLAGDVLFSVAIDGSVDPSMLLWPLVARPQGSTVFGETVLHLLSRYVSFLGTPRGTLVLVVELVLLGAAVTAWVRVGTPGVHWLARPDGRAS